MDHLNLHPQEIPQNSAQRCWRRAKCQTYDGDEHYNQHNLLIRQFSGARFTLLFIALILFGWTGTAFSQVAKNYQHWADVTVANWNGDILNAQKSDYFEGEVIPHVHVIKGTTNKPLITGQTYTFRIVYNFYQRNTKAGGFAFVTTYKRSREPGLLPGASGSVPLLDNTATAGLNIGGSQGFFYTINANITAASAPVKSGSGTFDNAVKVSFIYTGTDPQGLVEIYYGLYIAEPGQVPDQGTGVTDGASAWTGGSLQTTIDSSEFSGRLSVQLAPSAIIRGVISGLKYSDTNNNGTRDAGEGTLPGWTFYLDLNNNTKLDSLNGAPAEPIDVSDGNGAFSFSVTPDADKSTATNDPYYVRELQNQTGWTLTQPLSGVYGPIIISAADPTETGLVFGNFICVSPLAAATPSHVLCNGGSTGSATISASGGTSPYTFSDDGTTYVSSGVFGGLAAGTYTFYAKDANECIDDVVVTITEPAVLDATKTSADALCNGAASGTATISASGGTSPYTFAQGAGNYQSSGVFGSLAAGTYTFFAKDANNCIDSVSVVIGEPDPLTVTANATTNCVNGVLTVSLSITPAGGTGPYTITPVANDPYTFTVTDANGCACVVSNAVKQETTLISPVSSSNKISSASPLKQAVLAKNTVPADKLAVTAYPNPFKDEVNFIFKSPASGYASLEIFDLMGKRIGVVFKGNVEANAQQAAQFTVPAYTTTNMLVYRLSVGGKIMSGKILPQ